MPTGLDSLDVRNKHFLALTLSKDAQLASRNVCEDAPAVSVLVAKDLHTLLDEWD